MPPALDAGVMSRAKLAALWAAKAPALLKIQLQKRSPSNRHSLTFHPASSCKAAVNNASGVIPLMLFPLAGIYKGRQ